ncbi:MAG TPA: tetratricopeptide repeat protein [Vicinamibacterales bacterium]|nr:tetratricopeptide repeat protein [Vicinamibacterales bacterium]
MPSPSPGLQGPRPLAGHLVVFIGKLSLLRRRDARALVARLGGDSADEVNERTTMVVVGEGLADGSERDRSQKLKRAQELADQGDRPVEIVGEDVFCERVGIPTREALKRQYHSTRDILARYRSLREDHVRYLVKCAVIRPVVRTNADTFFAFTDLATIRQVNEGLERGASFHSLVQPMVAARNGQLELDFRLDVAPAKIITLQRPAPPVRQDVRTPARDTALAEDYFRSASLLDDGDESKLEEAAAAYRRALELDPYLVAALINLANIHYSRDELVEAQALYERAIGLESDFFEAHFNLGNIYHDLGRFPEAQSCYREALRLNPFYADAHFYLAVTFEKMGLSQEARPHWRAYKQLAPQGEWVELAKEFSE